MRLYRNISTNKMKIFALTICLSLISLAVSAQNTISDAERNAFLKSLVGKWSPYTRGWGGGSLDIVLVKYGEEMLAEYNAIIWCSNNSTATEIVDCKYDPQSKSVTINYRTLVVEDGDEDNYFEKIRITIPYQTDISDFLVANVCIDFGSNETNDRRIFQRY